MVATVNIGFGSVAMTSRILSIVPPDSAPIKRIVSEARESKNLLDATFGRRTRSVIIMDNGYVILSAVTPETIALRAIDDDAAVARLNKMKSVLQTKNRDEE